MSIHYQVDNVCFHHNKKTFLHKIVDCKQYWFCCCKQRASNWNSKEHFYCQNVFMSPKPSSQLHLSPWTQIEGLLPTENVSYKCLSSHHLLSEVHIVSWNVSEG
jgi:hypothetical protein